jgi:uncharacterized C2H2 Zn-finger protein
MNKSNGNQTALVGRRRWGPAPRSMKCASEEIARLRAEVVRLRERDSLAYSPNRLGAVFLDRRDEGRVFRDPRCEMQMLSR